jgi:SAM-dependent methyltransferase
MAQVATSRHAGSERRQTMKPIMLRLVLGLLMSFGCRTIPGQDVRYEPTPMPVVRALLELADVGPQDLVYDLGSGDGRIPITAAAEFGARGVGIEIDPALVTQAQAKAREAGLEHKVEFRLGDMYAADVRSATVVTLFLHPGPNLKLREKLRSDLQPGSRVVSYIWDMGGWTPAEVRRVNEHRIFLWRIPSRAGVITDQLSQPRHLFPPVTAVRWLARRTRSAEAGRLPRLP